MVLLLTDTRLDGADNTGAEGQQAIMQSIQTGKLGSWQERL